MLAAVLADGMTVIENAAKEPHIVDLANFLNAMGADVKGAGTDVIKIRGVKKLYGGTHSIIPDQIEAGTFMAAVAATGGQVLIKNVIPKHLECITAKLNEMGVEITEFDDSVLVRRTGKLHKANIKTLPYPGFPTDMQPQMTILQLTANGSSSMTETVFENRFMHMEELRRMNAKYTISGRTVVMEGPTDFNGAEVAATDLRAAASLVIAGLAASGYTTVTNLQYLDRGYHDFHKKLANLGAEIKRVNVEEDSIVLNQSLKNHS